MNATSRLRRGGGVSFFFKSGFTCIGTRIKYILFVTQLPSWSDGLDFLFGVFLP